MKEKQKKLKQNVKSYAGFTMTDLVIAITIFTMFIGSVGTLMYSSYKMKLQTKLSGAAVNYAIQILEDIDKIAYEEVNNGMEENYMEKYSISNRFQLSIDVSNYNGEEGKDIIKTIKLTISYKVGKDDRNIVIERMKIKEG